ncbi:hypothetical protein EVA_11234 [gut metagenome]|uniref:Uncharacterized protein n=1 Tax=gut metagenome TaxID=749906 RepID=J9CKS6_9ZZZZ
MAIQASVHHHTTFHIHLITHFQQSEIRTFQGFLHGSHRIRIISKTHHRQTNPIMRDTLIYFQLADKRTFQCEMYIFLFFYQCH